MPYSNVLYTIWQIPRLISVITAAPSSVIPILLAKSTSFLSDKEYGQPSNLNERSAAPMSGSSTNIQVELEATGMTLVMGVETTGFIGYFIPRVSHRTVSVSGTQSNVIVIVPVLVITAAPPHL